MNSITLPRSIVQQALVACEQRLPLKGQAAIIDELNNLRAALAQQAEPQGCATEEDCTKQPWCRKRGECQRKQAEPDHETRAELAEQQVVQLAEERDHYRNLWQKAQQAEPVEPVDVGLLEYRGNSVAFIHQKMTAYRTGIDAAWDAFRANGLHPDGKTPLADMIAKHTAPPQRDALLQALQNLVFVCQRMDLEHQAERPSEAEYQATMQAAQEAIHAVEGGA